MAHPPFSLESAKKCARGGVVWAGEPLAAGHRRRIALGYADRDWLPFARLRLLLMSVALRVEELTKSFGERSALSGVSFKAMEGELLGLLGPNGAGKTTLIRCLCGRVHPDAGRMELLGRELPRSGGRQRLGFVPQDLGIYPDLSIRENLHAFGVFNGMHGGWLRKRIDWALEWTGLEDRADQQPKTFSGGMKRRVNIACGVLASKISQFSPVFPPMR